MIVLMFLDTKRLIVVVIVNLSLVVCLFIWCLLNTYYREDQSIKTAIIKACNKTMKMIVLMLLEMNFLIVFVMVNSFHMLGLMT